MELHLLDFYEDICAVLRAEQTKDHGGKARDRYTNHWGIMDLDAPLPPKGPQFDLKKLAAAEIAAF
ncbi:MAG: hypothetical protein ACRENE_29470 [Polyangiaceae bacterium]